MTSGNSWSRYCVEALAIAFLFVLASCTWIFPVSAQDGDDPPDFSDCKWWWDYDFGCQGEDDIECEEYGCDMEEIPDCDRGGEYHFIFPVPTPLAAYGSDKKTGYMVGQEKRYACFQRFKCKSWVQPTSVCDLGYECVMVTSFDPCFSCGVYSPKEVVYKTGHWLQPCEEY